MPCSPTKDTAGFDAYERRRDRAITPPSAAIVPYHLYALSLAGQGKIFSIQRGQQLVCTLYANDGT